MPVADKKLRRSGELRTATEFALYRKNQSKPHARSGATEKRERRGEGGKVQQPLLRFSLSSSPSLHSRECHLRNATGRSCLLPSTAAQARTASLSPKEHLPARNSHNLITDNLSYEANAWHLQAIVHAPCTCAENIHSPGRAQRHCG